MSENGVSEGVEAPHVWKIDVGRWKPPVYVFGSEAQAEAVRLVVWAEDSAKGVPPMLRVSGDYYLQMSESAFFTLHAKMAPQRGVPRKRGFRCAVMHAESGATTRLHFAPVESWIALLTELGCAGQSIELAHLPHALSLEINRRFLRRRD